MQSPPNLFDTHTLAMHHARANDGQSDAWFIHDRAIELTAEKLKDVNRSFTKVAIIGWRANIWAKALNLTADCITPSETLDIAVGQYDLILHCMSLHWANDPVGQLVQMQRALRPDGMMLVSMFGGQTLTELRMAFANAESRVLGGISPRIAPMAEIRDLGGLLQRAGYTLPVADNDLFTVSYESILKLFIDLRYMGETNALTARTKTVMRRDLLAELTAQYPQSDGRIEASFELIFLSGWSPSDTQQKPLRPGSAKTRLADALGVPEIDPEKN